jgi:hypothetical protein
MSKLFFPTLEPANVMCAIDIPDRPYRPLNP